MFPQEQMRSERVVKSISIKIAHAMTTLPADLLLSDLAIYPLAVIAVNRDRLAIFHSAPPDAKTRGSNFSCRAFLCADIE